MQHSNSYHVPVSLQACRSLAEHRGRNVIRMYYLINNVEFNLIILNQEFTKITLLIFISNV